MRKNLLIGLGCVVLSASSAGADTIGNPGGMAPDTPGIEAANPAKNFSNVQDKLFVRQATLGGRAEVELGRLAEKKGGAQSVKEFGTRMAADHAKGNDRLMRAAKGVKSEIPEGLDPEHQTVQRELSELQGENFDIAYLASQIRDHQKTANLLQWHISTGQHQPLVQYSIETLPVVMAHLDHAKLEHARLVAGKPSGPEGERER
jgi:putative membrane protein